MSIVIVVLIRSFISFFVLLLFMRLIGKQQISELNFFDYVVGITIGSIAATISVQVNQNTFASIAGMAMWTVLPLLLGYLSLHSVWIRKVIEGEATVVIENGKILEEHLKKIRISIDDLLSLLREQQIFSLSEVEFALIETNGRLSVLKKSQNQPVTPSDLNIPTEYKGLPTVLISDGAVLVDALKSMNLSKAWLMAQLKKQNICSPEQVSMAQLDTNGKLYVDLMGGQPYYIIDTTS